MLPSILETSALFSNACIILPFQQIRGSRICVSSRGSGRRVLGCWSGQGWIGFRFPDGLDVQHRHVGVRIYGGLLGRRRILRNVLLLGRRDRIFPFRVVYRFRTCLGGIDVVQVGLRRAVIRRIVLWRRIRLRYGWSRSWFGLGSPVVERLEMEG